MKERSFLRQALCLVEQTGDQSQDNHEFDESEKKKGVYFCTFMMEENETR
jgi:hypothetical protein